MVIEKDGNNKTSDPWQRGCPAKVQNTFAGHPHFVEKEDIKSKRRCDRCSVDWGTCKKKSIQFVQAAKIYIEDEKLFLIGRGFSYLTVILPAVEPMVGGERG